MPRTPRPAPMNLVDWTLLVTLSLLWGGSFFFNEVAVAHVPPLSVVAARVTLAAAALWALVRLTGRAMPRGAGIWAGLLAMGAVNNALPFSLIVWGQTQLASGVASILNATTPLFAVVVAHLAREEPLTPARLGGVVLGAVGVAVMIGGEAAATLGSQLPAQLALLGAALSYALAGVFGRRFARAGVGPLQTATGQVTGAALVMVPLAAALDAPWAVPPAGALAALVGLALVSTALAYLIYFRLLASAGAVNLLLVTLLVPVSAIGLGIAFLEESLAPRHLLGLAAIALGLAAIDGRPAARLGLGGAPAAGTGAAPAAPRARRRGAR